MRGSARGAAHHCPADAETACAPAAPVRPRLRFPELELSPRARRDCAPAAPIPDAWERPMTFARAECGLGLRAAPQLHR